MKTERVSWIKGLRLPLVCAPMFGVSNAALVGAARRSGIAAALPRHNYASRADFEVALATIMEGEGEHAGGRVAVNLSTRMAPAELAAELALCEALGVRCVITAKGHPGAVIEQAHRRNMAVFCDVTSLPHARKARDAGADGLICIAQGGGGHSGRLHPMSMLAAIRREFQGVLVLAGALGCGEDLLAAQALGADLAYMGTRFIATREAGSPDAYKHMLVDSGIDDLLFTPLVNRVPANWLKPSLEAAGLSPDDSAAPAGRRLSARPWLDIWSAGQSVENIHDIPAVASLVDRLAQEYAAAHQRLMRIDTRHIQPHANAAQNA